MKEKQPQDILDLLHGCCGFFDADGSPGFSRFTEDQLAFYKEYREQAYKVAGHSAAGIYLDFVTDAPEISFRYKLYREFGIELLNSGFDIWEDDRFGAHIAVSDSSDVMAVTYRRRSSLPSRIRIYFPNGSIFLMDHFCFGDAKPTPRKNKKILFYGDSITQSAYIPNPSLSWYVNTAESLDAEYINRGIGSMIFEERSLPEVDDFQPDYVFVEYGANDLNKHPDQQTALDAAHAWLKRVCILYPNARIIGITPDFIYPHGYDETHWQRFYGYCNHLYRIYQELHIPVIRGSSLLPDLDVMFREDHVHLNEAGSAWFAGQLAHKIAPCI